MYYDKQIRYIDYLENGEKRRNCGYVKTTVAGGSLLLEMRIRDLYETDDVASEVVLEGGGAERRVGTVLIRQGCGSFRWEHSDREHEGGGIALGENLRYGQLEQIHVQLSPRRSLRCVWRAKPDAAGPERENAAQRREPDTARPGRENAAQESMAQDSDTARPMRENTARESMAQDSDTARPMRENTAQESMAQDSDTARPMRGNAAQESVAQEPDTVSPTQGNAARGREPDMVELTPENARRERKSETTGSTRENVMQESVIQEPNAARPTQGNAVQEGVTQERERESPIQERQSGTQAPAEGDAAPAPAVHAAEEPERAQHQVSRTQMSQAPHMASVSEDKWQQLQKIYPHIRPFQDEREYLSLRPEDFVILHSSAYRLVQNSFLLHGYFNYDHLILTRMSQKNREQYYIGVPGNYYEKEKQVAVMYGFESFECGQDPVKEGEFGYYMIRVEL